MNETSKPLTPEQMREKAKGTEFEEFTKANFPTLEDLKDKLCLIHAQIVGQLKKYCDMREDYYNIVALWIMGTWIHKKFASYPYLFFNAIKGSGKSRVLALIASLCYNGRVLISMSEAVMFRTAQTRTLLIDEFESVGNKEKLALRELLNSAYKRGGIVERAYKKKTDKKEEFVIESFPVYCPVVMANIWGMDNVLSDRCITIQLDKSSKKSITRLVENFDNDIIIQNIKSQIVRTFSDTSDTPLLLGNIYTIPERWNFYISKETLETLHTQESQEPQVALSKEDLDFFDKIRDTNLEGRPLELFFPLFSIANICGYLDQTIQTALKIVKEKKAEDIAESRDISLVDYLSKMPRHDGFISINKIYEDMKEDEKDWITPDWIGRALKRLNVIIERRRLANRREARIDWSKVDERIKVLLPQEEIEVEKVESESEPENKKERESRNPDEDSLT